MHVWPILYFILSLHAPTEFRGDPQFTPVITIATTVGTATVLIGGLIVGVVLKVIKTGTGSILVIIQAMIIVVDWGGYVILLIIEQARRWEREPPHVHSAMHGST